MAEHEQASAKLGTSQAQLDEALAVVASHDEALRCMLSNYELSPFRVRLTCSRGNSAQIWILPGYSEVPLRTRGETTYRQLHYPCHLARVGLSRAVGMTSRPPGGQ